jgi:hypothetical protein
MPAVLSDANSNAGITRVAAGVTALPFSLRPFADLGVGLVECPPEALHFASGVFFLTQPARQQFHVGLWKAGSTPPG